MDFMPVELRPGAHRSQATLVGMVGLLEIRVQRWKLKAAVSRGTEHQVISPLTR